VIPDDKIIEIRERTNIVEIIGDYVSLKRAGGNLKGVCPFHADSDPSFNVNPDRQFFHCFGCGVSGDVFTFVQKVEGIDFQESARRLADRVGVDIPERKISSVERNQQDEARRIKERRLYILETAATFWEQVLWSKTGRPGRELLAQRGVSDETARSFRLGFAPDSWQTLADYLNGKRIAASEAVECGLLKPRSSGAGHYDLFRNRLMFPIQEATGRPIAFSGRALPGNDSDAKYINSPETQEYSKGKVLFGLFQARVSLSKTREAILVEGNFDVVAMHGAGFHNTLAPMGTAFTEEQATLLRRRVDRVTVMFDGDRAGMKAASRSFPVLAKAGIAAYMAPLPSGQDPDSILREGGRDRMERILGRAQGLLDEIIRMAADASDGSVQDVARRVSSLMPYISAIRDSMERDLYRQKIASVFGVEPTMVFRHLRDAGRSTALHSTQSPEKMSLPGFPDERELLGLLLDLPTLAREIEQSGALALIRTPVLANIAKKMVHYSQHHSASIAELMDGDDQNTASVWLARRGLKKLYLQEDIGREALQEIKDAMRRREMQMQIEELDREIHDAHRKGDDAGILSLERKKTEIRREMLSPL
jgi:DNA primase